MALSAHQFNTLAVLARDPENYAIVWCGCGCAAFGCGDDPFDRAESRDLILSVPKQWRWPYGCTVMALKRKGYIKLVESQYGFIYVYRITKAGLDTHKTDPAFDTGLISPPTSDRTEKSNGLREMQIP